MARPTDTSAAAITKIKMNMTCPSACPHFEPAEMKASPAAFSMISIDSRMKMILRRASTPASPMAKSSAANINPYSAGTLVMYRRVLSLCSVILSLAEVISPDESRSQQEGRKFNSKHIRTHQCYANLLRFYNRLCVHRFTGRRHDSKQFYDQDRRKHGRTDP